MNYTEYFAEVKGTAVLSTVSAAGEVNSAIYSRPHCLEDGKVGFVMKANRSHDNVVATGKASYLFVEEGGGYKGVRLQLKMVEESADPEVVAKYRRHCSSCADKRGDGEIYFVSFEVTEERPLVGD